VNLARSPRPGEIIPPGNLAKGIENERVKYSLFTVYDIYLLLCLKVIGTEDAFSSDPSFVE